MTFEEQTCSLCAFGYTVREASFLVKVALHSGYFLMRQMSPNGGKVADRFGKKLVAASHATAAKCASNTSLFHVKAKAIYRAVGQENNRHRRAHNPFHIRSKVMGFDYVLQHPAYRFLPTEDDKVAFFCRERGLPQRVLPTRTYTGKGDNTERFFIDKYPIRIDPANGKVAFCFVDDGAFGGLGFETWLGQYDALVRALGGGEVVYISPDKLTFETARRQFTRHFSYVTGGSSADLAAYFELRKDFELAGLRGRSQAVLDNMKRLRRTFQDPQFDVQYAAWLHSSKPVPTGPAVEFSPYHLPHSYRFFGVKA